MHGSILLCDGSISLSDGSILLCDGSILPYAGRILLKFRLVRRAVILYIVDC